MTKWDFLKEKWQRIKFKTRRKLKMMNMEFRYHKRYLTNKIVQKKHRMKHLVSVITRRCSGKKHRCGGGWAYLQHSNCAYVDELLNYNYCCKECHEEIDAMYQEWWDEYNASRY